MSPSMGRVITKQFIRNKPNPEGIKVFVRSRSDGVALSYAKEKGRMPTLHTCVWGLVDQ